MSDMFSHMKFSTLDMTLPCDAVTELKTSLFGPCRTMGPRFRGQIIASRKFLRRERTIASTRNLSLGMKPADYIMICSVEVRDFGKPRSWAFR